MRSAPSVVYPVGRSRSWAAVLVGCWAIALAVTVAWVVAGAAGWRAGLAVTALIAAAAWLAWSWWRSPVGQLAWDGARWTFQADGSIDAAGHLEVATDLQRWLLVRWRGPAPAWLWLERSSSPAHWDALRRAVYSRPDDDAPPGALRPPPASP